MKIAIQVGPGSMIEHTTLAAFIADNADALDARDIADMTADLTAYRPVHIGGGAAPLVTVRNVEPVAA